jgi:site-specific DNA-cytosine methylase
MKKNVLSLFDGISGFQSSLKRASIKIDNYYSSEIDQDAMKITNHNFPNTIQLGDVRKINSKKLPEIWMIVAGSPCQDFSITGKRKGMVTIENIEVTSLKQYLKLKREKFEFSGQSYLFWEVVRTIKELKPKYFIVENVAKMDPKWKYIISKELGVLPIMINSSLLSIQNRERYYWTNIPGVSHPSPKKINLSDIIPNAIGGYGIRGINKGNKHSNGKIKWEGNGTTRIDGKINCITTSRGTTAKVKLKNGTIRNLTIQEAEMAQTLPKNYTKVPGMSETKRWHGIGNGFTIDVMVHILRFLKKNLEMKK